MQIQTLDHVVFLRSLLRNPVSVGAVIPSSRRLCDLMVSRVDPNRTPVLEVGAGTGSVTKALLKRGVPARRLYVIERDPALAKYLARRFPRVRVICGDAIDAADLLAEESAGLVKSVVSSLPMRNLTTSDQMNTVQGMLRAMALGGQLIQFTYTPGCPIPTEDPALKAECLGRVWINLPPAFVWRFTRAA